MEIVKFCTTKKYYIIKLEQKDNVINSLLLNSFSACKFKNNSYYIDKNEIIQEKTRSIFFWNEGNYRIYKDILSFTSEEIEFESLNDAKLYFELIS